MLNKKMFYFITSVLLNWLIGIIVIKTCHELLPKWMDVLVGLPLAIFLMITFTKFYVQKYFRHEE